MGRGTLIAATHLVGLHSPIGRGTFLCTQPARKEGIKLGAARPLRVDLHRRSPRVLAVVVVLLVTAPGDVASAACNIVNGKAYGDCGSVRINTEAKAPLTVSRHVSESAIIAGATILDGGSLVLSGVSNGDITVNRGGRLFVSGVVLGVVRNFGGAVEIEGTAQQIQTNGGTVLIGGVVEAVTGPGAVTYKAGSVIGGVPTPRAISR